MGEETRATNAKTVLLLLISYDQEGQNHPRPNLSLSDGPTSGRKVAATLLKNTAAASAEAE